VRGETRENWKGTLKGGIFFHPNGESPKEYPGSRRGFPGGRSGATRQSDDACKMGSIAHQKGVSETNGDPMVDLSLFGNQPE